MHPPLDVPSAPSRSSTGSTVMPRVRIAVFRRLAEECGLSPRHFARAFRQSTGVPPHRWLMRHRVQRAKELLRRQALSLADIALRCGFADQSHFTRVFSREVGFSPGQWRRDL